MIGGPLFDLYLGQSLPHDTKAELVKDSNYFRSVFKKENLYYSYIMD